MACHRHIGGKYPICKTLSITKLKPQNITFPIFLVHTREKGYPQPIVHSFCLEMHRKLYPKQERENGIQNFFT